MVSPIFNSCVGTYWLGLILKEEELRRLVFISSLLSNTKAPKRLRFGILFAVLLFEQVGLNACQVFRVEQWH